MFAKHLLGLTIIAFLAASCGAEVNSSTKATETVVNAICASAVGISMGHAHVMAGQNPNRMRSAPSLRDAIISSIPAESNFYVFGGPICADGIVWWQISYQGMTGWTAEGQNDTAYLQTGESQLSTAASTSSANILCNNAPASRVNIGSLAQRATNTRFGNGRVRKGPGQNYPITRVANSGETFTIIGGPACGGSSTWWQVKFTDGFTGWMMEGFNESDGADYYIDPA